MIAADPSTWTLPALLAARVAETPHAMAFMVEGEKGTWSGVTWSEFGAGVANLREALHAAGLRPGDRLAIAMPVGLDWETLHHAAVGLGAVVVGLDAHDRHDRLADVMRQAGIAVVVTSDNGVAALAQSLALPSLRRVVLTGAASAAAAGLPAADTVACTWASLMAMPRAKVPEHLHPGARDLLTIIFTSGTSGQPKGIAYTHGQVGLALAGICETFAFVGAEGRLLCWLPLSNLFQRMVNLAGLQHGATTYLLADPRRVMDVVSTVSPDVFVGVPRFYEKLLDGLRSRVAGMPGPVRALINGAWGVARRHHRQLAGGGRPAAWLRVANSIADAAVLSRIRQVMGRRLRCMVTGSAPMPRAVLEELNALGWTVLEAYGLSENVVPMAMNRLDRCRPGSVGVPMAGNEIRIAEDGEVRVRGPGVFGGYLGAESPATLDAEGFYATGDLGHFDAQGFLHLSGRKSDLIKTSTGRRVAPMGIEAVLQSVFGVDHAVVFGDGRPCLVALCTTAEPVTDEARQQALARRLREAAATLAPHDRPAAIAFLPAPFSIDAGELTSNLKICRRPIGMRHAARIDQLYEQVLGRGDAGGSTMPVVFPGGRG